MKKIASAFAVTFALLFSSHIFLTAAQAASCSNNNIVSDSSHATADACYEDVCTAQSQFDSQACIAYATADANAAGSPQCANITDDNVYNQCCNTNSGDSPMCVAYNTSDASDENGNGNKQAAATNNTQAAATNTNSPAGTANTVAATNQALNIHLNNPLSVSTIGGAISLFMSVIIRIALPLIILFFIWSGLMFIFARGNPEKIKVAKNMFFYTVIGTLLILGAWVITNAIIGTVSSIIS